MLFAYSIAALLVAAQGAQITFVNNYPETIWVGSQGNSGMPPIEGGGWQMANGEQRTIDVGPTWGGRFWGRTGCNFDGDGNGHCVTGDCGDKLKCDGNGGAPPATLAELTQKGDGGKDFYDVSNVDGFNIPVTMEPTDNAGGGGDLDCKPASCTANINDACPEDLRQVDNGQTVGCKSACLAFNTDQYCCRNEFGTRETCDTSAWPNDYHKFFKDQCPTAYSYAYDDPTSLFTCSNTNYKITFG